MDEKCQLKRQEDKADVTKNKEKPKRMEAPIPQVPRARSPPRAAPQGQEQIFYHIRDSGLLRPPKPMKKYPNMKHSLKYCEFYEDFGHSTTECFTLQEEIESLILSEYLKEFVAGMREAQKSAEQDKGKRVADGSPEREVPSGHKKCGYVQMIMGGPTLAGQSRRAIKGYGRSLSITTNIGREVNLNEWGTPKVPHHPPPILFTEKDAEGISYPHDDTLVVTLKVATGKAARTLVDTSSSVDIIFKSALDQLLIESPKITPYATPLIGFARDMVIPKGIITLPVTLGKVVMQIAREVASACRLGVEVAIVLRGRNFFCGDSWLSDTGFDRPTAYQIGVEIELLLYWILNLSSGSGLDTFSAALSDPYSSLEKLEIKTRVQSAFALPEVDEPYSRQRAIRHLEKGRVVIFGGIGAGTGNPVFTTDAAAALGASELNADAMVKGVSVNGIYDSHSGNGHVVPEHISYREAVSGNFMSMDTMAITYCEENGIPVVVLNLLGKNQAPRSRSATTTLVRSRSVTTTLVRSRTVSNDLPGYDSGSICT
ncbi:Uridine monophosphate kinase [Citrus sinensis]|nr:Uridine monophosphate kinase [Citrus sinensis]